MTQTLINADTANKSYVLSRNIPAIQLIPDGYGHSKLGTILHLPEGTQVDICGEGFNDRTVKVSCQGGFYFIFLEDVESDAFGKPRTQAAGN